MKKILIFGVNGFIGHHLAARILATTDWQVHGMDLRSDRVGPLLAHPAMHFAEGDIRHATAWIERQVSQCDVVLPLAAIATPSTYVSDPLRVFELDFEANLPIVRAAARYGKHLVFPSTSEVYGMSRDTPFDPASSELVYGPINKPRWIYACAKQLMDRVIWGYGMAGLNFTLFRPFNWIGPGLDSIHRPEPGSARVVSQFLGHILRGEVISLVDGGAQRRTFTYIDDGIAALMRIIENRDGVASGQIYNIGNPANEISIRALAGLMLELASQEPAYALGAGRVVLLDTSAADYYGGGYQDVPQRVPLIANTCADLHWQPRTSLTQALRHMLEACRGEAGSDGVRQ